MPDDDVKKVEEIIDVFSEKGPEMIKSMMKTLYSKEAGKSMGEAVAAFYKELTEAGIEKEVAIDMTRDYLNSVKEMSPDINHGHNGKHFDFTKNSNNEKESNSEDEVD